MPHAHDAALKENISIHADGWSTSTPAITTSTAEAKARAKRIRAAIIASFPRTRRTGEGRLPEVSLMMTLSWPVPNGSPTAIRPASKQHVLTQNCARAKPGVATWLWTWLHALQNSTVAHRNGTQPITKTTVSSGVMPRGVKTSSAARAEGAAATSDSAPRSDVWGRTSVRGVSLGRGCSALAPVAATKLSSDRSGSPGIFVARRTHPEQQRIRSTIFVVTVTPYQ